MKTVRPTREQLIELAKNDPEKIADLVLALWDRFEKLETKVAELERNSRNSSKPPSSDKGNLTKPPTPPNPKSLREKTDRKPGGQKGHPGASLQPVDQPDFVVEHRLGPGTLCPKCGRLVGDVGQPCEWERRQLFELPAIRFEVSEHRAEKFICECGETLTAAFPESVKAPTQYGPGVQATSLYFKDYQLIPYERQSEIFADLFGASISVGTLANFAKRAGEKATVTVDIIRDAIRKSPLMHCDETGCRVHGLRNWLHVASTPKLTFFHIDARRGVEALKNMSMLDGYKGGVMHDFWSSYYTFHECFHLLCNAHHLRDLVYMYEEMNQNWAQDMIALLLEAKKLRDRENARLGGIGPDIQPVIDEAVRHRIRQRYAEIVLEGFERNPEPPPPPSGKRGRVARGKVLNMLSRFDERYDEVMAFFEFEGVPFDNNQAERDLRMMKTREKVSGTFRSDDHAASFSAIRSIISTARKQSKNIIETLRNLLANPSNLGQNLVDGQST